MSEIAIMMGKFTKTDNPPSLPGTCRTCGGDKMTAGIEWFIDMGYSDDWGGVYHCNRCIDSLARFAGYVPKTKRAESQDFALERQLQAYALQFNFLRSIGIDVNRLLRIALADEDSSKLLSAGERELVEDTEGPVGSSDEQGSSNVPSTRKPKFSMGSNE